MIKTLWLLDALLLAVALGMALFTSGQDAAGRGILWFFPLAMTLGLGGSWLLERGGSHRSALAVALAAPILAGSVFFGLGRSLLAERRERSGASYWDDDGLRRLAKAISEGDAAGVRVAAVGVDVNAVGRDGMTPLIFAVTHAQATIAPLIQLGANPDLTSAGMITPLERALNVAGPAFDALLAGGANPNGANGSDEPVLFSAIRSGRPSSVDTLIIYGANISLPDARGWTSLMVAVEEQQWTLARKLLVLGVDHTVVARDGASVQSILARVTANSAADPDLAAFMAELASRTSETR
ncbi:MAG: hypothetical protein H7Z40_09230 [Phycisphaerae bacterium]|nr:hypothetical protein [Gemmatimonadaceae bacterium]